GKVIALSTATSKPVHLVWLAGRDMTVASRDLYRRAGLPVYSSVSQMADTAASVLDQRRPRGAETEPPTVDAVAVRSSLAGGIILEADATEFLDLLRIVRPSGAVAHTADEAATIAARLGSPVVLKAQSGQLTHKSDAGGVRLRVAPGDAAAVWTDMR